MRSERNLVLLYRLLVCLLVLLGIQPLLRLPQEIGRLYLGVPLSPSLRGLLFVNPETASHWPGIQAGLRARDRILSIEGQSAIFAPHVLPEVAAGRREGDPVQVEVLRGSDRLIITVPLRRYRLAEALELHGLWFLAGLTTALASWLLFRPPTELMALALALIAGLLFAHGNAGYADPRFGSYDFYPLEPMWTYGYYLLGAVLVHFAWRFPRAQPTDHRLSSSQSILRLPLRLRSGQGSAQASRWLVGLYGMAFALGTTQEVTRAIKWIEANEFLTQVSLVVAAVGVVGTLIRLAWLGVSHQLNRPYARVAAGAWSIGMLFLLVAGIAPFWSSDAGMLLSQFLLSIAVVYPLLVVYAMRQVELVETLEHEVTEKQRWAELAQELRRFREEDLRRVANELHDTVLADLRGVQLQLERLLSGDQVRGPGKEPPAGPEGPAADGEIEVLQETVRQIQEAARLVTQGVMPLDFHRIGLQDTLTEALQRFRRMAPGVDVQLQVEPFDAEPSPAVREAMYWTAVSALNNCRDHAQASSVRIFVSVKHGRVQMTIRDDGVGFDVAQGQATGLGLRNMRARATQVGGELEIESDSRGTTVRFHLTLPPRERPIRVLVVEDSQMFVAGLRTTLVPWAEEVEIVGVVDNAQEALILAKTLRPDIVLLDLRIRERPKAEAVDPRYGLLALARLVQIPSVRSVVMSVVREPAWLRAAGEIGAWGFWDKDQVGETLVSMLRRVAAGERVLTAEQWAEVEKERLVEKLSPREWEVLLFLEQGLSTQRIAERLEISGRTVEKHVEGVLGKLGVHSRLEAVARARELGLLSADRREFPPPDSTP